MPPDESTTSSGGGAAAEAAGMAVSNDQLAAQLMECAILVKKGEKGPLLRKTIHDLTDYLTSASASAASASASQAAAAGVLPPESSPAGASASMTGTSTSPRRYGDAATVVPPSSIGNMSAGSANSQLSKHQHKAPPFIAGLGKMIGLTDDPPTRSLESKAATSAKNAQRIKAEVAAASHSDWCEEHFTMGCACKTRRAEQQQQAQQQQPVTQQPAGHPPGRVVGVATAVRPAPHGSASSASASAASASATTATAYVSGSNRERVKPAFQRPSNPSSSLIANGWIEQQRRSKMRVVWKDVLASLVEGRKRGEETTLWIQREVTHERTGHAELEALHQIPVKLIEQVQYLPSYAGDYQRFVVKVYNVTEEYTFRCRDEEAAQNWVLTLRSVQQLVQKRRANVKTGVDDWEPSHDRGQPAAQQPHQQQHQQQQQPAAPHYPHPSHPSHAPQGHVRRAVSEEEKKAEFPQASQQPSQPPQQHRMTVTELRAIAHGAGYNTHGMERGELEALVAQIAMAASGAHRPPPPQSQSQSHPPRQVPPRHAAPPSAAPAPTTEAPGSAPKVSPDADELMMRRQQQAEDMEVRRKMEELRLREEADEARRRRQQQQQADDEAAAKRRAEEAERQRVVAERVREQQAAEKKRRDEEERKRLAEERLRRDEEEIRRRAAEKQAEEQRRKQEEAQKAQQQQWQQQQQAWQKQQAEEEQRRRAAEAQAAEARRQQEEAYRRQQQWQQQQNPQYRAPPQSSQPFQQQQQRPAGYPPQGPGVNGTAPQGYPPQQQRPANAPPYQGGGPHAQSPPPPNGSAIDMKYAKMAQQGDDGAAIWNIKHGILVQWALLPPMMQVLRPIEDLLTTVHKVFPPQFGVPGHEYFTKWTAISKDEITQNHRVDDAKLKKAMRKLRFFLHPDKLPRDLSKEQSFMCKMLWDILSDAEAEHKKKEEELGWIRG